MRWGEDETLKFVKIYLSHELLWNRDDAMYKLKSRRQQAFRDISRQFNAETGILLSEIEVRIKIKNLRNTYFQEVAKIRQRSNPDYVYKPAMKWFYEWHKSFIILNKDTSSNESNGSENEPCQEIWLTHSDNHLIQSDPFVLNSEDEYNSSVMKSEPGDFSDDKSISYNMSITNSKLRNSNVDHTNINRRLLKRRIESDSYREDEFDIYGKYIASQLRSMDLQKAIRAQLEIQNIVSNARLSCLMD